MPPVPILEMNNASFGIDHASKEKDHAITLDIWMAPYLITVIQELLLQFLHVQPLTPNSDCLQHNVGTLNTGVRSVSQ